MFLKSFGIYTLAEGKLVFNQTLQIAKFRNDNKQKLCVMKLKQLKVEHGCG